MNEFLCGTKREKILFIILILVILIIGGVLIYQNLIKKEKGTSSPEEIPMAEDLKDKKIAMVIAFKDFRDEEYFIPKQILEAVGAEVTTVSDSPGKAVGTLGGDTEVSLLLEDINTADFDAVLFIGGSGAQKYIEDQTAHKVAEETVQNGKVLGAICIGPAILAKAGVLDGKKATVWSSVMDKSAVKILEENGASFQSDSVVVDGKIITASGPVAAKDFAQKVIELLR